MTIEPLTTQQKDVFLYQDIMRTKLNLVRAVQVSVPFASIVHFAQAVPPTISSLITPAFRVVLTAISPKMEQIPVRIVHLTV